MSPWHLPPASDSTSRPSTSPSVPTSTSGGEAAHGLSRRALLAATAAAVPGTAAVLSAAPAIADPTVADGDTRVVDVPLDDAKTLDVEGVTTRDLPEQPATMVGVTWPEGSEEREVSARGLTADGTWTDWLPLETAEDPETGDQASGTEAAWLGAVSALQLRVEIDGADASTETTAHVVTTSPAAKDEEAPELSGPDATVTQQKQMTTMAATATANPATPTLGPGMPSFITRASWGADESTVRGTSAADSVKAVIIHHTAGTNSYTKAESAQIVRGILSYHTGTLGWADVGYNILVDKYGQIFEGRSGGLHRNIVGAHAYGFNTGSFGISVLGDYSSTTLPAAGRQAVGRLVAWKLLTTFQTSVTAKSSWTPGSGTRFTPGKTISLAKMMGHRDVNYTECPGLNLYNQFGTIRKEAQGYLDGGWKEHLWAFEGAGGASKLGTVVKSNHVTGSYHATILTKGLVLQEGSGKASGYATPFAAQWRSSWGRPTASAVTHGTQTAQKFEKGAAVRTGSASVVFHDSRFIDVPPEMMYRAEIEELASRKITTGWDDGTYRPLEEIQRDAMVAFVYRALGSPAFTPPKTSPFSDMPPSRQFYKEITWAHAQKITSGWDDGTFRPTASVERGAVAAFLYRASKATSTKTSNPFSDVPANHQFAKEITWLADREITTGWEDGTFRPTAPIARDAMAAFMIRWMKDRGL
ncbi:S-layer homology domain-containing protein [Brachybacterium alimentarium]|uniref:S-layer homology domain-containing protein n=1 Tax=Brachybacterium alimentarium TaxID=47845 RepID=UPI003FD1B1A2